ncbi:TonB-dependent receptor [Sphingopyxis sp. YF1]|uniref:TonB-dependent receptor n=1 Tax=Sphingopyxis sp. YF1 TaxID=2482763 RepID=UPI001F61D632|nr:TonB-dependent receptor [Sphingopyxis sp. YF1]UNU43001.1 TonB-dependent receptor [Sphingopyxis sp. YF1]HZG32223.1 TonB-dependent receptor [Sphingopyxis sp.]
MKAQLFASASAAALFVSPAVAMAQSAGGVAPADTVAEGQRDENDIIVTATRRAERLQDVPLSVTAFGQQELDDLGVVGFEGIAQNTPGIVVNRPTQNFNNFTSRGINTNGYSAGLQSAVAIYVDELPISANGNSTILDPNLYDVERVEFLRGPQGTLFGSNSLAGAMRILTKSPDLDEFQASASVDIGLTGSSSVRQRYNAMVNVPIMKDEIGLRVTGYYRDEDGWVDNIGTGVKDSNSLEAYGGRAILLLQPSDRMKVKLLASYENSKPADSALTNPLLGKFVRRSDRPDLFQGKLTNYNITVNYEFDFAELISSTTLSDYDASFYVDLAGTFAQAFPFALDAYGYDDLFVQETRLVSRHDGPFEWVAGFFYYDKRRTVDFAYRSSPEYLAAKRLTGLPNEYYQRFNSYTDQTEIAGFGEATYRFSDRFWITGGLRYGSTEVQSFTRGGGYNSNYLTAAFFNLQNLALTVTPIDYAAGLKVKDDRLSWKGSVSWKPTDSLTTYATVSTGFRTPVVNARAGLVSTINPNDIVIPDGAKSDSVTNYELGLKGRWLGGDLTANLAAYYIDWKDIQVQANRVSDSIQFATNIGAAESYGLEFEVMARPVAGLSLALNGSFNRAKVTELTAVEAAISGAEIGTRLASPKFQGSGTLRYDFAIGGSNSAFAAVNVSHAGAFPNQFPNVPGNPNAVSPTYDFTEAWTNVNLFAGAKLGALDLTAYVENIFDDSSITYVHPEAFLDGRYARLRPRTIGVRANYRF